MINFIVGLGTMLLVTFLFGKIRGFIKNRVFNQLKKNYNGVAKLDTEGINASVGNVYKKNGGEAFTWKKFFTGFGGLLNPVGWAKDVVGLFNIRKLVLYGIVIGAVFGYAYFQGRLNAPVKINLSYDKEWVMNINGEELYKPKYSNDVYIRDSKTKQILKQIKAKDMGELRKKLKPVGFILEPIFIAGGSVGGTENKAEIGAGVSFIKYWRWRLDAFLTSYPAGYIGTSYAITEHSGAGLGVGKGLSDGSNRVILYYRWKF